MSNMALAWALNHSPIVDDIEAHLVLIYLADNADDDGKSSIVRWPVLAERLSMSVDETKAIVGRLFERGVIADGDQRMALVGRNANLPSAVFDLNIDPSFLDGMQASANRLHRSNAGRAMI